MNISLQSKTAVVCGSSQGIGFASALEMAKLGATCILIVRNESALQQAVEQLPVFFNQQHQYLVADFNRRQSSKISN